MNVDWIDISDKMPPESEMVICHVLKKDKPSEMHSGRWNGKFWIVANCFGWDIGKVTHWVSMPENYPESFQQKVESKPIKQ